MNIIIPWGVDVSWDWWARVRKHSIVIAPHIIVATTAKNTQTPIKIKSNVCSLELWSLITPGVDDVYNDEESLVSLRVELGDSTNEVWSLVDVENDWIDEEMVYEENKSDGEDSIVIMVGWGDFNSIDESENIISVVLTIEGEGTTTQLSGNGGRGNCVGDSTSAHSVSEWWFPIWLFGMRNPHIGRVELKCVHIGVMVLGL